MNLSLALFLHRVLSLNRSFTCPYRCSLALILTRLVPLPETVPDYDLVANWATDPVPGFDLALASGRL